MNEADLSPYQLTKRMISKIVSYCCVKKQGAEHSI